MFNIFTILLTLFVAFGVSCLIYSFLGVFIHENNKKRLIITIVIAMFGLAIYSYVNNDHVVYMKEDVLYIKPKSEIEK